MKLAWNNLVVLCLLWGCSGGGGLSAQDKLYYQEMQDASQRLKTLQSMSQTTSFAKVRYQTAVNEMLPKTQTTLKKHKENSHRVIFELLEDENVKDFDVIKKFIKEIKNKGVQIAIDDFGAGYSNFERILEFEPDIIKIDGSLIKNIQTDVFSRDLVETIVAFAKKQNIKTVGEFVENEAIFNILNEIGVDYSQGYYFGKPISLKII